MLDRELEQPLSPELVLVSPDLRERVASVEPDIDAPPPADVAPLQEAPLPATPVRPPDPPAAPTTPDPSSARPPDVSVPPPDPVTPAAPPPVPPSTQTTSARVEWRLTVGAATILALSALLVFGAGVAVGQLALPVSKTQSPAAGDVTRGLPEAAPVSAPITAAAPVPPVPRATSPRPLVPSGAVPSSSGKTHTQAEPPKLPAVQARPVKQQPGAVRPVPNSGYAFFDGSFQLTADGRKIKGFTLRTTACSGELVVPSVDVSPSGAFAFSGHPPGSLPGTIIRLKGRFVSRTDAKGTSQVTRGACNATATPFVAHLS